MCTLYISVGNFWWDIIFLLQNTYFLQNMLKSVDVANIVYKLLIDYNMEIVCVMHLLKRYLRNNKPNINENNWVFLFFDTSRINTIIAGTYSEICLFVKKTLKINTEIIILSLLFLNFNLPWIQFG